MTNLVYTLCGLTSLLCAFLLLRSFRRTRHAVLRWSGLCFVGLTVSNFVLIIDKIILPDVDLLTYRLWLTEISLLLLVYGLLSSRE
ncbi:DUF5985 family protein [Tahibacter amnicola]|uniref:DUF5985 family protein n=1 Tax=Tahibacter amnicola TaxID=2976241 RepID=A0ABY6BCW9_9GAMM|nr:DUF5985 family protein [Tahibacter amnicola]UXI66175.1 DUF5985 family protein [Tahibacter amnicola]